MTVPVVAARLGGPGALIWYTVRLMVSGGTGGTPVPPDTINRTVYGMAQPSGALPAVCSHAVGLGRACRDGRPGAARPDTLAGPLFRGTFESLHTQKSVLSPSSPRKDLFSPS